jgi:hypothetical protein
VPLPLAEGAERFVTLYLVFADRETTGPGALQLAQIIRQRVAEQSAGAQQTPGLT